MRRGTPLLRTAIPPVSSCRGKRNSRDSPGGRFSSTLGNRFSRTQLSHAAWLSKLGITKSFQDPSLHSADSRGCGLFARPPGEERGAGGRISGGGDSAGVSWAWAGLQSRDSAACFATQGQLFSDGASCAARWTPTTKATASAAPFRNAAFIEPPGDGPPGAVRRRPFGFAI